MELTAIKRQDYPNGFIILTASDMHKSTVAIAEREGNYFKMLLGSHSEYHRNLLDCEIAVYKHHRGNVK